MLEFCVYHTVMAEMFFGRIAEATAHLWWLAGVDVFEACELIAMGQVAP